MFPSCGFSHRIQPNVRKPHVQFQPTHRARQGVFQIRTFQFSRFDVKKKFLVFFFKIFYKKRDNLSILLSKQPDFAADDYSPDAATKAKFKEFVPLTGWIKNIFKRETQILSKSSSNFEIRFMFDDQNVKFVHFRSFNRNQSNFALGNWADISDDEDFD